MADYQFTIKPEHEQHVQRVKSFIKAGSVKCDWNVQETKDGIAFLMEFKEQYQVNKFDQNLKATFPYLFIK
ncbi:MAG: hypothetical protein JNM71_16060 [Flavobacterium lindanitolerans]|uniref:hypothetical protein n=1 Tax=Flavobacterium lindanitolerans TaxID=428988 RepID=UPI001A3BDD1E|nr:hypothetical protein [Flavobacterium lindanitolerans]MBL7869530.1 hypothetical protein [Flavobacterium lindanitolerans]